MMSLTFGLFTQVSGSGPLGPLVQMMSLTFGLFTQVSGSGPLGRHVHHFDTYILLICKITVMIFCTYELT